ncbi:MAG: hypothetical protein A4E57_04861 [Syntrophorhabdaceae bacterium PtaU1.Bin034]|nr:MAG: hypothetical protein A4E57_04861 [Syntrophorhabdaceae bacterium PtaU1.Bin034]
MGISERGNHDVPFKKPFLDLRYLLFNLDQQKIAGCIECLHTFKTAHLAQQVFLLCPHEIRGPFVEPCVPERSEGCSRCNAIHGIESEIGRDRSNDLWTADCVTQADTCKGMKERKTPEDKSVTGPGNALRERRSLRKPGKGLVQDNRFSHALKLLDNVAEMAGR